MDLRASTSAQGDLRCGSRRILAPTDFADSSRAACDVALELARQFHVPLVLLHVYQVPTTINRGVPFLPIADYVQLIEDSAQSALNNEAARLRDTGADVATRVASVASEGPEVQHA